jgi:hypothetical protein
MIRTVEGQTYNPPKEGLMNAQGQTLSGTETVLDSVLIPANTFTQYDVVDIISRIIKTGTNQTPIVRIRIGPSINTSQTLVATNQTGTSSLLLIPTFRRLFIQNVSNSTYVLNTEGAFIIDLSPSNAYSNITTIDWTVDNYIIITVVWVSALSSADVVWSTYIVTKLV